METRILYVIMNLLWCKFTRDSKQRIAIFDGNEIYEGFEKERKFSAIFGTNPVVVSVVLNENSAYLHNFDGSGRDGDVDIYAVERNGEGDYTLVNRLCREFEEQFRIETFFRKKTLYGQFEVDWWGDHKVIALPFPSLCQELFTGTENYDDAIDIYIAKEYDGETTHIANFGMIMDSVSAIVNAWHKQGRKVYALVCKDGNLAGFAEIRKSRKKTYTVDYRATQDVRTIFDAESPTEAINKIKKDLEDKCMNLEYYNIEEA